MHLQYQKKHFKPKLVPNRWVFVDKPPLTSTWKMPDWIANVGHHLLQPRKTGPYRTIKVQSYTVVIDEDGDHYTVSLHQKTAKTGLKSSCLAPWHVHAQQSNSSQTMSDVPEQQNDLTAKVVTSYANPQIEDAVERIVGNKHHGRRRRYIAQWYVYRPRDDTMEQWRIFGNTSLPGTTNG